MIDIQEVKSKRQLYRFIHFPAKLHKNHKNWVTPIYSDEWDYFNPKKNRAHAYCDTVLALSYLNGKLCGRIMGIVNHRYNNQRGKLTGRFSMLECVDNQLIANSLLSYIEQWSRQQGMNKLIGPYGMCYLDPEGFLTEGFEYPPTISTNYNFEYMIPLMENNGYSPETNYVVYKLDLPNHIPEVYYRIRERVFRNGFFQLLHFSSRKELLKNSRNIISLMNECFGDIYGYSLFDELEMNDIADKYMSFLDPRFVMAVNKDDEMIGFIVAMPNLSDGLRKAKGYLFPFGFFQILKALRNSKQIDLLLGGVKKKYQGTGVDVILGMGMVENATKTGFILMDSHSELESNTKMRAEMERMGGVVYKKYRVYQKNLL
jgi:hypothetical protein